jgi:hypothetical protein
MSSTPASKLLLEVGLSLGRSEEQMQPVIQKLVIDEWFDSEEALRGLVADPARCEQLGLPLRLVDKLKERLGGDHPPPLEPVVTTTGSTPPVVEIDQLLSALRDEITDPSFFMGCVSTLTTIFNNILREPENEKFRSIKLSSDRFQSSVGRWMTGVEILRKAGFVLDTERGVLTLPLNGGLRKLAVFLETLQTVSTAPFDPYRESLVSSSGSTFRIAPDRLTEIEQIRVETVAIKAELNAKAGGDVLEPVKLVHLDKLPRPVITESIDPDQDRNLLMESARSIAFASDQAQRFKSRERSELEKLKSRVQQLPKTTRIRIAFSDKRALELLVSSHETIGSVYSIFARYLLSHVRGSQEWTLTVSPPLRKLERNSKKSLLQEEFVPAIMMRMMIAGMQCISTDVLDMERIG